jgi:cytochrome P450|tara:strand:- start:85 stop:1275 length:1191 start_codon:yes stop_codon:yes gene_type:complete
MSYTISDFKTAGETLRVNDLRQALYDAGAILMDKVLVNLHGKEHQMRRKVEAKILRPNFYRWYETEVFKKTLDETITPYLKEGKADLVDLSYRILLNLTADFSGIDRPDKSVAETERILSMLRTFGKAATLGQAKGDKDAISNEINDSIEAFNVEFYKPSKQKRLEYLNRFKLGEISESDVPKDVLTELLKNQGKLGLSDDIILKETAFYLLAGAFTSIHTLTHAMHELFERVKDPTQENRLMNEPIYLQRCIHESMRLHPSSPTAMRRPTCPYQTNDGKTLNNSDTLVINLMEANRDVSVFGLDAKEHNPERNLPSGVPPYGLSFGKGMHACIGVNLAAGIIPKEDTDPLTHQYGIITLTAKKLLEYGAVPNKNKPGVVDRSTVRNNWSSYPILF